MRFHFDPTPAQRTALEGQLARLQQPAAALELLAPILAPGFAPAQARCTLQSVHSDRFVVQVRVCSRSGEERVYALKAYADDFGEQVWAHAQLLAGRLLSKIVDGRKVELLRHAAAVAADVHRVPIVPERLTTAQMLVDETRARCDNLRPGWPGTAAMVEPLLTELHSAVPHLDSTEPAPVHGDMAAGQFLWTGDRLVLLDWDMVGSADPASDAGHFLAQLE